jgi:hypothetical protein
LACGRGTARSAAGEALVGVLLANAIVRIGRPLRPHRNIDHRPPRADARNKDHRERLARRDARRQRRPDGARRQLWKTGRNLRRQALIGTLWIDRVDRELTRFGAFIYAITRIATAPTAPRTRRTIARMLAAAPTPARIDRTARTTGQMAGTLGTAGKPAADFSAFVNAIVGVDRAPRVIKVNWLKPD